MPYKVSKWCCSTCGRDFKSYEEAVAHEHCCDKCQSCKNAYFVYGCEFACEHEGKDCNYMNSYPFYTAKEEN